MSDQKISKRTNWIAWAVTVVSVYVVGFLWILGPQAIWTFLHGNDQLNTVGDFLAGIFAFPAFILLAAAVLTQRQELNEAREQFEDGKEVTQAQLALIQTQNDIAHKAAKANYKLALHEKRLAVYLRMKECGFALTTSGTIEKETRQRIYAAVEDAKFVFGDEVNEYIKMLSSKTDEIMRISARATRLSNKGRDQGFTEKEEAEWNNAVDAVHALEQWFYENLTYEILEEKFTPSLKLPDDIN
ncbi:MULTISPECIES: hypothetical protein [Rhizobium]|uniref:hypothetical protein n=1 Tax=Rhizobium TaxID=379 RepID=UPI001030F7A3|nr:MULTISPECIES: hypothetical protein [Rhizobium]MBA1343949.1 hypothetical protein [Rhizobium sp. WYCCWR 11146]TBF89202.1 hypothetical protein ELG82_37285 [Rhizobium leguminosarum]